MPDQTPAPAALRRPALLLDVDGPLNPYAAPKHRRPDGYTTHRLNPLTSDGVTRWATLHRRPLRVWLNPRHGKPLLRLRYDLVWATTWVGEANVMIGPHIGLPELPVITWGTEEERAQVPRGLCWKTPFIVAWAKGRPFAWVDDDITGADRAYVAQHHDGPALLHRVDPRFGLRTDDFTALAAWYDETQREAIGQMLRAGASRKQIATQLGVSHNRIVAARSHFGIRARNHGRVSPGMAAAYQADAQGADDGHVRWTGSWSPHTPRVHYDGRQESARRVAFRLEHGREPQGYVLSSCGESWCVARAHMEDRPMRADRRTNQTKERV